MNALLLDSYHADCTRIVARWNKTLESHGLTERITLPTLRFNRKIGICADQPFDPQGNLLSREDCERGRARWLPSQEDYDYVASCMVRVRERGKFANWIAPPHQGINGQPIEFEYVQFH